MVAEAEEFAADDEAQKKRIEALNSLSSYVYGLKTQVNDADGLGGKLGDEDKKTLLDMVKETTEWIDDNGATASAEDLEDKLQEAQNVANPITAKLYGGGSSATEPQDSDQDLHDEL